VVERNQAAVVGEIDVLGAIAEQLRGIFVNPSRGAVSVRKNGEQAF
jgi:hypothetical protein